MSLGFGMLLALAIVVLVSLLMAGVVVLLRNRDSTKSAKTKSSASEPVNT
jgi:heme/copper-type cytochrome/quinol oxidase subunit 2